MNNCDLNHHHFPRCSWNCFPNVIKKVGLAGHPVAITSTRTRVYWSRKSRRSCMSWSWMKNVIIVLAVIAHTLPEPDLVPATNVRRDLEMLDWTGGGASHRRASLASLHIWQRCCTPANRRRGEVACHVTCEINNTSPAWKTGKAIGQFPRAQPITLVFLPWFNAYVESCQDGWKNHDIKNLPCVKKYDDNLVVCVV